MGDWADERAREWLEGKSCAHGHIYNAAPPEGSEAAHHDSLFGSHADSLAALLRDVAAVGEMVRAEDAEYLSTLRADVLAEVRRVVQETLETPRPIRSELWNMGRENTCTEILSRLEALK